MLILITYDVDTTTKAGEKRLRKVARECVNYGQRVQNSVFECFKQEAELFLRLLLGEAKALEHLLLNISLMDTNGTAADLITIQYDIISLGTYPSRLGL